TSSFSNICVEIDKSEQDNYLTDNSLCYAKVLLIVRITSPKLNQKLELALVH
ncbi:29563_t:CDS:2, partial [Racocetra persica]